MSKIYEALLRAEMDRIAQINQATEPNSATNPIAADQPIEVVPAAPPLPRQARTVTTLSPAAARSVEWHPDQARLLALQSRGVLVEQVRVLRSRLYEMRLDRALKTILLSSGLPEEGKSFVAANLAVALAKSRQTRVLLIDGDMRRGTLHRLLGAPQEPGLAEYLSGAVPLDQVMQHMPQADAPKGLSTLSFIPSGRNGDSAADLSGNGRFELLLRSLYDHFEWIIVDSSPVTLVVDGVNLARHCDGVLLVARGGVTKYEIAQRALQELKASKVLGVVLNAVKGDTQVGGYYGYDT